MKTAALFSDGELIWRADYPTVAEAIAACISRLIDADKKGGEFLVFQIEPAPYDRDDTVHRLLKETNG